MKLIHPLFIARGSDPRVQTAMTPDEGRQDALWRKERPEPEGHPDAR
jgi:hypothetical protein